MSAAQSRAAAFHSSSFIHNQAIRKVVQAIMRKKRTRTPVMLALAGLLASLVTFVSSGTAVAAEYIPPTQWSPVKVSHADFAVTASPSGAVAVGCAGQDDTSIGNLRTYSVTGQLVRELSQTEKVDGVENCISWRPAIDKNGDLYGTPEGLKDGGSYGYGPNLLAYSGNTLKWKYPTGCSSSPASATVGADGNIYFINGSGRLIGLTPDVAPPTTQPKKVLDAPASISCPESVRALKDGIAVEKNGNVTFYSYGGANLGGPGTSAQLSYGVEQISATGRFFYSKYISSAGLRSAQIYAYDYGRKQTTWTATASADGAYVYSADPFATPDGGVLVRLNEKETDQFGAATGNTVYTLFKLSSFGIEQWREKLPRIDASGNSYSWPGVKVDTNGKIAVIRPAKLKTSSGSFENAVSVAVLDGGGNATYSEVIRGNLDQNAGNATGYSTYGQTAVAPNTLYVTARQCSGTSCYGDTKLFPLKVTGLGLDYPRGEVLAREKRPATPYLALGDSFSAGEGVESFEPGTNFSGVNECHRSNSAYARLISGSSPKIPALGVQGFRACSGAVTDNIRYGPQWNEPGAQLDLPAWPDTTTQLVTLTIGGNDIRFGDFAKACIYWSCAKDSTEYGTSLNAINNTLPSKLVETYKEILQRTPNAKIYVLGYPHVIADKKDGDANDARCSYMYGPHPSGNEWADVEAARDIVTKLNKAILDNVAAVRALNTDYNQRLKYVPLDGPNSPFNGHEICGSGTSWFQNVDQAGSNPNYVFHPNKLGQELGYAVAASTAINAG